LLNPPFIFRIRFYIVGIAWLSSLMLESCQEGIELNFVNQPVVSISLDEELDEISALCVYKDQLAAVQDEKGTIFLFNLIEKSSKELIKFKERGDFEGLAFDGNNFFVLGSNGDIFQVDSNGGYRRFTFQAKHKKKYDFEGLTYDPKGNQLLVLCKKHGNKKQDSYLWIYRFDLMKKQYLEEPFLKIQKSVFNKNLKASAIHLQNDDLWLLSASTHQLVHLNTDGNLIKITQLDRDLYPQAEGICITSDNLIYIATEKKHNRAAFIHQLNQD
jgi:Uncharacterized protein conserved in bacteria